MGEKKETNLNKKLKTTAFILFIFIVQENSKYFSNKIPTKFYAIFGKMSWNNKIELKKYKSVATVRKMGNKFYKKYKLYVKFFPKREKASDKIEKFEEEAKVINIILKRWPKLKLNKKILVKYASSKEKSQKDN